jgi:hypothetical protein
LVGYWTGTKIDRELGAKNWALVGEMQNVPKIVRERLKAATSVANHPDADLLTAFAERSLPELERAIVLEHLARCEDCRDVLALALPSSEPTQTVISPVRGGWLTWPALRWGFVAAGAIAIVSLGILQYQRHFEMARMVAKQAPVPEAVTPTVPPPSATQAPAAASGEEKEKPEKSSAAAPSAQAVSAAKASPESNQRGLIARVEIPQVPAPRAQAGGQVAGVASGAFQSAAHNQFPHGPQQPTQWQQQNARVQPSPPMTPSAAATQQSADLAANAKTPAAPQTVSAEASPTMNVEGQDLEARLQAPTNQGQPGYALGGPVDKAKPPVNVEAAATQTGAGSASPQELPRADNFGLSGRNLSQLTTLASVLPRWTISPTGGLQRSLDQGKTWQDVDVSAGLTPSANASGANYTSVEVLAKKARAKDNYGNNNNKENYSDKKALKAPPAIVVFRAVAAMGSEVWAGGSQGALYHSLDAGGHWTQVIPSADGAVLTGDVVAIEFSDPQHGMIRTSTAETWATSDRGQAWQKQQ